jgi:hypothetical protein
LESIGFEANDNIDPCLFISDKVICLVYVDDTLFFSPKEDFINEVIDKLSKADLDLEVEDSVAGFLGVHIDRNTENGTVKLTQSGLAKRVVEALNVGAQPRKFTPALKNPLVKDEHGEPPNGHITTRASLECFNIYKVIRAPTLHLQSVNVLASSILLAARMKSLWKESVST